ncbi:phage tail protein [Burkholderia ubonensis]|nr:phage tail protein [Burkholderia ubonensis]
MDALFEPSVSHRFMATFFFLGLPSPVDLRFQRISGLNRQLEVTSLRPGGENVGAVSLPERVTHGPLVLERGVMTLTPLTKTFDDVLGSFELDYASVIIMLLNAYSIPVASWTLTDALPVRWQMGDLDANSNTVLINTLELAYREMSWLGVKA